MVVTRKERRAKDIKLSHPDRSGPTEKTLLQMAEERNLFNMADEQQLRNDSILGKATKIRPGEKNQKEELLSSSADRVMEAALYAVCMAMLHFTLDYLVQHQYAMQIEMPKILQRTLVALLVFGVLVYTLHPHPAVATLVPGLPPKYDHTARQAIFLVGSLAAGCYLIHITNKYSYMAVLKQAPPVGCIWVWTILELDLSLAVFSLTGAYTFFWAKGYGF
ncbi:hypothetical protein BD289DRAFT_377434 [Coniella lustricola]|uniref:DUF7719 domain-containing protein n=1 Tax=Coniella lustricola TaxID=2025994 RepID=A0A2T2ZVK3_9PEZI|nr:hypothetical protein BD289DRAFT_377434 [Coniella lustricola]